MKIRLSFKRAVWGMGALVLLTGNLAWAQQYSHARIVRLSFKEGTVTLVRPAEPGAAEASVNTPIQEGFKLTTAEDSFLEVEFENTSTARVGQLSELDFAQLALDTNGGKLNRMELPHGYATFSVLPEDGDVYEVKAGDALVELASDKPTRFRVDLDGVQVRVEVFKGAVNVSSPFGEERVTKNNVLELRPGTEQPVMISHGITKDAWDEWVEDREDQAQVATRRSPPGLYTNDVSELLYGWNDLYYYGSWANVPGYGYGWVPTVGFGWTPYSYGQWVWYPGLGYTWISYEPWGWTPFHYGGWVYEAGFGWCWIPGGFSTWAPSLVSWYEGPDWVAWTARPPRPRPGGRPFPTGPGCSAGQTCFTVMSTDAFRAGLPVRGHTLGGFRVTEASAVEQPGVQPPQMGVASFASQTLTRTHTSPASPAGPTAASGNVTFSGRRTGPETAPSSVVYDATEGRYVNGPARIQSPARVAAPSASAPATAATISEAPRTSAPSSRPAPVVSAQPSTSRSGFGGDHHASPRSGIEPSRPTGIFERTLGSWGIGTSTHSSAPSSSSSGSWSAPASTNSSSSGASRSGGSSGSFGASAPHMSSGGGGGGGGGHATPSSSGATPHR